MNAAYKNPERLQFGIGHVLTGTAVCAVFLAACFSAPDEIAGPAILVLLSVAFSAAIVTIVFANGPLRAFAIGAFPGTLLGKVASATLLIQSALLGYSDLGGALLVVVNSAAGLKAAAVMAIGTSTISGVVAVVIQQALERSRSSESDDVA